MNRYREAALVQTAVGVPLVVGPAAVKAPRLIGRINAQQARSKSRRDVITSRTNQRQLALNILFQETVSENKIS